VEGVGTDAATLQGREEKEGSSMLEVEETDCIREENDCSNVGPSGDTAPMPVTTTRQGMDMRRLGERNVSAEQKMGEGKLGGLSVWGE